MKGFDIMKKSAKRIAATAAAVMMMLSGSAIGANAVSVERNKNYSCTHYKMYAYALIDASTNKAYIRNLTTCKTDCAVLYAQVSVSGVAEKHSQASNVKVGDILTPNTNINSCRGKTAMYTSYYKASSAGAEKSKKTLKLSLTV